MKFSKSILLTVFYCVFLEFISFWLFLIPDGKIFWNIIYNAPVINSIIILILVFKYTKHDDLPVLKKTKTIFYPLAILLGIGYVFFQSLLNILYFFEVSEDLFNYEFTLKHFTSLNIIAYILTIPITEELFFRNFIQRELSKNYKPHVAILFASLLFAFIHIPFTALFFEFMEFSIHHAYIALFGGLISGILFYKSKSIIPSILFHIFWNLTVYVL